MMDDTMSASLICGHTMGMMNTPPSNIWRCAVCQSRAVRVSALHKAIEAIVADGFRNLWTPYEITRRILEMME